MRRELKQKHQQQQLGGGHYGEGTAMRVSNTDTRSSKVAERASTALHWTVGVRGWCPCGEWSGRSGSKLISEFSKYSTESRRKDVKSTTPEVKRHRSDNHSTGISQEGATSRGMI